MFKFLLVAALVPAMAMATISFSACPNGVPAPTSLTVNDCTGNVCILVAGQPLYALASGIVSPIGSSSVTASIGARVSGVGPAYQIPIVNTGGIIGGGPVVAGVPFDYAVIENSVAVPARGVFGQLQVDLIGDGGITLACVRFNAEIL
ncbi:mite group 2 allergen Gly d 2.02-like [Ochlerotatus camptorhynchus]|uniref:mite group 2 allergen Gly d 2.02-like n=1 Tax=Ochlerotatus camptorhynchus TaxID=644619 RepID=UPI0031D88014